MDNYILTDSDKELVNNLISVNNAMLCFYNSDVYHSMVDDSYDKNKIGRLYLPISEKEMILLDEIGTDINKNKAVRDYVGDLYKLMDININRDLIDTIICCDVDNLVYSRINEKLRINYVVSLNEALGNENFPMRLKFKYQSESISSELYSNIMLEIFNAFLIYMNEEIDEISDSKIKNWLIQINLNIAYIFETFEREILYGTFRDLKTLYLDSNSVIGLKEIFNNVEKLKIAKNLISLQLSEIVEISDKDINDYRINVDMITRLCLIKACLLILDKKDKHYIRRMILNELTKFSFIEGSIIKEKIIDSCYDPAEEEKKIKKLNKIIVL